MFLAWINISFMCTASESERRDYYLMTQQRLHQVVEVVML